MLPFTEFYIAEYRLNPAENNQKGIIIWHARADIKSGSFIDKKDYIKPVYKNGGKEDIDITDTIFTNYIIPDDMYHTDDIWSADTSPSSDFYNGYKTGAYMEVLDMDDEKATVKVGFKDVGWEQPTVSVTGGYNKENRYIYFSLTYDDVYTIMGNKPLTRKDDAERLSKEIIDKYVEVSSDDIQAHINYDRCTLNGKNQVYIRIDDIDATENEGAMV